jgi:methyl-accepting chemotaxis protein
MYFWETYPSPVYLQNKSVDDLTTELKEIAPNFARNKVELILDCVQNDGDTIRDYQEKRDFITRSLVRDLEHQIEEIEQVNAEIEKMLKCFDYKLTTMPGIGTVIASK